MGETKAGDVEEGNASSQLSVTLTVDDSPGLGLPALNCDILEILEDTEGTLLEVVDTS